MRRSRHQSELSGSMSDTRLIERWLPIAALGEERSGDRRSMNALPSIYYLLVPQGTDTRHTVREGGAGGRETGCCESAPTAAIRPVLSGCPRRSASNHRAPGRTTSRVAALMTVLLNNGRSPRRGCAAAAPARLPNVVYRRRANNRIRSRPDPWWRQSRHCWCLDGDA